MKIGIIGLGYVGLPLCLQFAKSGAHVLGIDLDNQKTEALNRGESYIKHIASKDLKAQREAGRLEATTDYSRIGELDAVLICVPTPLNKQREPNLSYVLNTARSISPYLSKGVTVILESTTYPGTTEDELRPILEAGSKMKAGEGFYLAYSPEREDPGMPTVRSLKSLCHRWVYSNMLGTSNKSISNCDRTTGACFCCRAAEATVARKHFRCVNIALAMN